MLWDIDGGISLVDFGLAKITHELEHYGLDFHLMHECFGASHPEQNLAIELIVKSYLDYDDEYGPPESVGGGELPIAKDVISRFEQIKTRVRYHG
jgi:tRNA A-37 threonylcarbamoyl transferase component Bud32